MSALRFGGHRYDLVAVAMQVGARTTSGHWRCVVRRSAGQAPFFSHRWVMYDDVGALALPIVDVESALELAMHDGSIGLAMFARGEAIDVDESAPIAGDLT